MTWKSILYILFFLYSASSVAQHSVGETFTSNFIYKMLDQDKSWFSSHLKPYPNYFSQRIGQDVRGKSKSIDAFIQDGNWLLENGIDSSSIVLGKFIYTRERMIQELMVNIGDTLTMPMAVVVDVWDDKMDFIRLYYDPMQIDTSLNPQNPIFAYNPSLKTVLPNPLKGFLHYMERADAEDLKVVLKDSVAFRDYNGFTLNADKAFEYLDSSLVNGGMKIHTTRVTYSGKECALEYNMRNWSDKNFTAVAAISMFKIVGDKIVDIRNYGAIETPVDQLDFIEPSVKESEAFVVAAEELIPSTKQVNKSILVMGLLGICFLAYSLIGKSSI